VKLIRNFVAVGVLFASGAWANSLINGSFELASTGNTFSNNSNPYGNGDGEQLVAGSTSLGNWSIINNPVSWLYNGDFGLTPQAGSYFLDLTGYYDPTPFGGVTQAVYLAVGNYTLSFYLGYSGAGGTGTAGGPVSVAASATEGTSTTLYSNTFTSGSGLSGNNWALETSAPFSVTTAGTVTISLVGKTGNQYIGLDNVDLEQAGTGVPEPAMILPLALAGALFVLGRRKRATLARYLQMRPKQRLTVLGRLEAVAPPSEMLSQVPELLHHQQLAFPQP
jgi:hypothetical protein